MATQWSMVGSKPTIKRTMLGYIPSLSEHPPHSKRGGYDDVLLRFLSSSLSNTPPIQRNSEFKPSAYEPPHCSLISCAMTLTTFLVKSSFSIRLHKVTKACS